MEKDEFIDAFVVCYLSRVFSAESEIGVRRAILSDLIEVMREGMFCRT